MEITEVNFAETFFQRLSLNFLKMVVNRTKVFFLFLYEIKRKKSNEK